MNVNGLNNDCRGFTLIEAMICILVVSIGLLAISRMQIGAMKGNRYSLDSTEASLLTSAAADRLMALSYSGSEELQVTDGETEDYGVVGPYTIQYSVTTVPLYDTSQSFKRIVLSTSWKSSDGVSHTISNTVTKLNDF
jgi:prepilin-type N-terminal cleavage/methylation domain-containing protein